MGTKKRILIVDDDTSLLELLVEVLESDDFSVCCCSDADHALDVFRKDGCDLVITDFGLPRMSGMELAAEVKKINAATPVIMLTGWGTDSEPFKNENQHVDYVLTKPFSLSDLTTLVMKSLSP
jgi:DNA-binding response OmpR family regulator